MLLLLLLALLFLISCFGFLIDFLGLLCFFVLSSSHLCLPYVRLVSIYGFICLCLVCALFLRFSLVFRSFMSRVIGLYLWYYLGISLYL